MAIVLDTGQSAEEVVAFYTEQLTAAGWTAPESIPPRQGGFLHSGYGAMGRNHAMYYREDGPSLQVMTQTARSVRTSVLVSEMPAGSGPMRRGPHGYGTHYDIFSVFPPIMPPPKSQQFQEGGSGSDDRVTSTARVESDLDLPALAAHYVAQLERGGWQRTSDDENGPAAWSTWTFASEEKEPWRALLVILTWPDVVRHYWVHLLAEWVGEQSQGGTRAAPSMSVGGWTSATFGARTQHPT